MARGSKADKNSHRDDLAWDTAVEVPRSGLPDAELTHRRYRRFRRYANLSMVLLPILLVITLLAVMRTISAPDVEPVAPPTAPATQPVAMAAVRTWLAQDPSPLPGASLLTWQDYTTLPKVPPRDGSEPEHVTRQSHDLLVQAATGSLLQVQVLVVVADDGSATALGEPSLVAMPGANPDLVGTTAWSGLEGDSPSPDATKAVETWAAAYTGGDPLALRQVVGDPNTGHAYLPLSGLDGPKVSAGAAGWLVKADGDTVERTGDMVVSVTLTLPWTSLRAKERENPPTAQFDLLVAGADTGAPRVVAWGGPGTGPTLVAYQNAVTGTVTETGEAVATDAPTAEVDAPQQAPQQPADDDDTTGQEG